ncbi:MAG: calcium/sodium antiporter [Pseudomonadota bacterium]
MAYLLATFGLLLLLFAGDALVRGAVNLALRLGIPTMIVSLTIVAFGTSAPELVIAVGSILEGAPGLAMGNVVGSNTANILLVMGVPALFYGLATGEHDTRKTYVQMLSASILFIALAFFGPFTWIDGLILLAVLVFILYEQGCAARSHRRENGDEGDNLEGADASMPMWKVLAFLIAGMIGLPLAANLLVDNAVIIATRWGVPDTVIGLTLIAIGTSLPELATTMVAAYRRQADVALGNVIGSNLFNLLGIIGVATLFGPIPVEAAFLRFDLWIMLAASLALAPFVIRRMNLNRFTGAAFTAGYALYILVILI